MSLLIFIFGKYRWQGKEIKGRLPINKGPAGLALAALGCTYPHFSLKRAGGMHTKQLDKLTQALFLKGTLKLVTT